MLSSCCVSYLRQTLPGSSKNSQLYPNSAMALLGSCNSFQNYCAAPMTLQGSFKNFQTCSLAPVGLAWSSRNLRNFTAEQLNPFLQGRGEVLLLKGRLLRLNWRALPGRAFSLLGCEDCSNAADWRLDSRQRVKRGVRASYNPDNNIQSQGFWTPADGNVTHSIWSIRNDLEVPTSIYAQGGQGPPPMLAERFQSVITQLFQHRIIRCGGAVDDDMANLIVAQLLYLDAADPNRDIIMYVNSPGGSVTAGMAVFDTMRHIRPDVSTVCVGLAASMGAFLLSGGTKGKRYSLPNSRIMIHQPLGGAQGQQTDIEIQANEILHHKANLNGYLAYHTGQPLEKIVQDTDRDFFMSAKEAKEYGLIDAVISNPLKALQPLPAPVPA